MSTTTTAKTIIVTVYRVADRDQVWGRTYGTPGQLEDGFHGGAFLPDDPERFPDDYLELLLSQGKVVRYDVAVDTTTLNTDTKD